MGSDTLKAFSLALLGIIVCAIGAAFMLDGLQMSASDAFATSSVRLDHAGENFTE